MALDEAITTQSGAPMAVVGASMNVPSDWCTVLNRHGAIRDDEGVLDFGQPAAELAAALSKNVLADLSHYGVIEAKGDDARQFLGNLLTGDVRIVTPSQGLFTAWCDAKGRAQATFWLLQHETAFYLVLPRTMLQSVLMGLKRYLLRVKVTLTDASTDFARLGLAGAGVAEGVSNRFGAVMPILPGAAVTLNGCSVLSVHGAPQPRWLVLGSSEAVAGLWEGLGETVLPVGRSAWNLLEVSAGVPLIGPETVGEFIPQMLDMEALGGLCFTKGCYPGQEVIARLHYRGQLKRRMYRALLAAPQLPAPGTRLHSDGATESIGDVVAAARCPDGQIMVLAVVKIEERDRAPVRLLDADGPQLTFIDS